MAKAYRFRLAPVLKLRQHHEDERKRVVAATLREIADLAASKVSILGQIDRQVDLMRETQLVGSVQPMEVARHRFWLSHLQRSVLENDARVRLLQARLAQERTELGEAAKQRKILETLRDRQRDRFQRDQNRLEQREADEMATTVYLFQPHRPETVVE